MLNAHPDVAVPPESRFVVELWPGRDETSVKDFLTRLAAHKRFQAWELPVVDVAARLEGRTTASYRECLDATYGAYAAGAGKKSWGDKTPRYVEHMELIASIWPEARFVHMVRDGRNVARSYADVPFGPKTVAKAAALWKARVEQGRTSGGSLGPARYFELRYEDLVTDIAGQAKRLCGFLDVAFDEGMLDHTEKARNDVLPRAAKYNPRVLEKPQANVRSWATEMPASQIAMFEAVAGDLLSELGYERRFPTPGSGARLKAKLALWGLPLGRLRASR